MKLMCIFVAFKMNWAAFLAVVEQAALTEAKL
jgi:hypothetical protein